ERAAAADASTPSAPGATDAEPNAAERRFGPDRRRPIRVRSPHDETLREAAGDFVRRVYKKADQDQIFFMAGAIAFNVLVAIVPLLLATLGIAGQILQKRLANPEETLLRYIRTAIPPVSEEFAASVRTLLSNLLDKSSGFTIVGLVLLVWFSTRLVGTLRATLREVFDVGQDRSIVAGKLFDIKIVVITGSLFAVNVSLTFIADLINALIIRYGRAWFGLQPLSFVEGLYLNALAIGSAWIMFLLVYRYLPFRGIHWRTAVVAATFTTTLFELLKRAFAWYVSNIADYASTYGNLATLIVLFLWVYYSAIIFILGGEVGQVAALRRIRRRQKERLT
ncbi:MAG TPA: YihY/virulence factor BrkB family protein, partial [Longimicrobiales bacterium]|nr:YihY/virulence factor BrkB family protein [Longimicrobiales bacterium]